jgi:polyisoprenyl-phosphate glycosyltransferase
VMESPLLGIVVPCFREEKVLAETAKRLGGVLRGLIKDRLIDTKSYLLFVDDGSDDETWSMMKQLHQENSSIRVMKLARNSGHQNALLAGLMEAKKDADCLISIDADLQDDVNVIREFILRFHEGYEVVYGVRKDRKTDTWFKRTTALGFYTLMKRMGVNLVYNHADYRLISRQVAEHLEDYSEVNLFLRGIIPLIGFSSTTVFYDRQERFAGVSKYPLKKMLSFAWDGITSFSVTPIRLISIIGMGLFLLSLGEGGYAVASKLLGHTVTGWASLMVSIWLIGGLILMALGTIGEYVGKVYMEVKRRPKYFVETYLQEEQDQRMDSTKNAIVRAIR